MLNKKYLFLLLLLPFFAQANNGYNFDKYVVYHNAFTADTLPASMASAYGILRSKYKGVLNLSIQQKAGEGKFNKPVNARVTVKAVNLTGQMKELDSRRVTEGEAIYYISEFRVSNEEIVTFNIEVLPEGEKTPLEFKFKRQFYTD
jgi:hypothetical protein